MKAMKRKLIALIFVFAVVAVAAVLMHRQANTPSDKVTVAASYYPLYDFAKQVGGTYVTVSNLTPAGAEPHDYEPSARSLADTQEAAVFVYNGGAFEPWAAKFAKDYTGVAVAADYHVQLHDNDPHFWLDPVLSQQIVQNIANGLRQADPEHADYYQRNAEAYSKRLSELDAEFRQGLARCQLHDIVSSHDAFGYVGRRYGFAIHGIAGISPEAEPDAARMQQLADLVTQKQIGYIFFESLVSPRLADTIATETGARTLVLNPIEGLSDAEQTKGSDYLSLQRENLANLRTALACR